MSLTNPEKMALDRHILSTPFENERPSPPTYGAIAVPDRAVRLALGETIGITKEHIGLARKSAVQLRARAETVEPGREHNLLIAAAARLEDRAFTLRLELNALVRVWTVARQQVRR